ncbi:hypothetical protein B4133_3204 [Bacillus altitudinis]|nr:hypothetical protein B4133_3204 [Bacillus altitudinis]PYH27522.1 hypothetical protein US8_00145 [Bacillus altitudinis]
MEEFWGKWIGVFDFRSAFCLTFIDQKCIIELHTYLKGEGGTL